jgi:mRNA-degrading endonuclease RelE of RelBE toxin-antitoxin system
MTVVFVESEDFTEVLSSYFVRDDDYHDFQKYLIAYPEARNVIAGCSGKRKIKWSDPKRNKGKRGGIRLIYLYIPEIDRIYILDVYNKDEAVDLSKDQKKILSELARVYKDKALRR